MLRPALWVEPHLTSSQLDLGFGFGLGFPLQSSRVQEQASVTDVKMLQGSDVKAAPAPGPCHGRCLVPRAYPAACSGLSFPQAELSASGLALPKVCFLGTPS